MCQIFARCRLVDIAAAQVPSTLRCTPYTRHPTPCTLHHTPYTLDPDPYTLHPTPYTLHLTPYTRHLYSSLSPGKHTNRAGDRSSLLAVQCCFCSMKHFECETLQNQLHCPSSSPVCDISFAGERLPNDGLVNVNNRGNDNSHALAWALACALHTPWTMDWGRVFE